MSDKMKIITAIGLAGIAGSLMGHAYPRQDYSPREESNEHKKYREERRNKNRLKKKSQKANRK